MKYTAEQFRAVLAKYEFNVPEVTEALRMAIRVTEEGRIEAALRHFPDGQFRTLETEADAIRAALTEDKPTFARLT